MTPTKSNTKFLILLLLAMASWGIAWPSAKLIVDTQHPNVIIFWRFLLTAVSLIPVLIWRGHSIIIRSKAAIISVIVGAVLYTAYNQFFLLGLSNGLAGAGGVLVTTMNPILTYGIVHLIQWKSPRKIEWLGLALGLGGGLALIRIWELSLSSLILSGNLFFILCAISWALLSLNSHNAGSHLSSFSYSFYVYSIGTLFDFFLAYPYGISNALHSGWMFWGQIFYIAVISTTFGTTMYFLAAAKLGSRTASSFIFLVPVTALLGSWMILGEAPAIYTLIGGAMAIVSVILLNRPVEESPQKAESNT